MTDTEKRREEIAADEYQARFEFDAKAKVIDKQHRTPEHLARVLRESGASIRSLRTPFDEGLLPEGVHDQLDLWAEAAFKGASMILSGPVGSGKTMAAVYAMGKAYYGAAHVIADYDAYEAPRWFAPTMLFVKAHELYAAVFARKNLEGASKLSEASCVSLLVIDDFGAPYDTEWPMAEMDALIDRRYDAMLPTVLTTNLHPTDGSKTLLKEWPRVVSRLSQHPGPGVVVMDQKDQRKT